MDEFILPLLDRFQPEMILVSYGFDPHYADPLGSLQLTAKGYGRLIESLVSWSDENCDGQISLFLEGGYDLEAAQTCSLAVTAALLGEDYKYQSKRIFGNEESSTFYSILEQAKLLWEIQ